MILGGQSHRISKGLLSFRAQSIQALTVVQSSGNRRQISLCRGPRVRHTVACEARQYRYSQQGECGALLWGALILFAFTKFRKRAALWFLLGTPVIVFWFFVLFLIAWGSAHNIKVCP
jgi:hypothetical protein